MSEIADLRDLQREYSEKRDHCYELIQRQDQNLRNCMPSAYTIRAAREREEALRANAHKWQERVDAIQRRLDELIGVTDD